MQDQPAALSQQQDPSSAMPSGTQHPTPATKTVGHRLKKCHAPLATGGYYQNGAAAASSGPEKCENGHAAVIAAAGVAPCAVTPVELSESEQQIVRLIGQHLKNLGMDQTVETLVQEANLKLEHAAASRFRVHVLEGHWDKVMADLKDLASFVPQRSDVTKMKFMILEQKYLELLEKGQVVDALGVLQREISPMNYSEERVHALSSYLMFNNTSQLHTVAGWKGSSVEARGRLLEELQSFLPPLVMLPPRRLETLLRQALQYQYSRCTLHNSRLGVGLDPEALLVDHKCSRVGFPCELRQVLTDHCDEVWCALFSHNGRYLATGSKEPTVFLWEVDRVTRTLKRVRSLGGHTFGAAFFSWSPDDRYLAVVGAEEGPDLWIWNVEKGELRVKMSHSPDDCLSAVAWHRDGSKLVCGGPKGQFYHCDSDGNLLEHWEGVRIRSLWYKKDGQTVLAADTHHRIRAYTFDTQQDLTVIREQDPLIYFCLDSTERYALCTTKGQGLHLWDLESRTLVRRYKGSKHGEYIVVSCFGGDSEDFVATGSEDGRIYIWHRSREEPVRVLSGHTDVVNAVTWNPVDPSLLVSCSDDGSIRVWGPEAAASRDPSAPLAAPESMDASDSGFPSGSSMPILNGCSTFTTTSC